MTATQRRRKTVAAVVGIFLTFAFAVGQAGTVFAVGGTGGASRPSGTTKPASAKPTPAKPSSGSVGGLPTSNATSRQTTSHRTTSSTRSTTSPLASAGGDFSMDFIAAGPGTYDHDTGLGGAYNNRTIDKNTGVVESLEGGDFACGDKVVFFGQFAADSSLAAGTYAANLTFNYGETTTGQPGIGFDDVLSVSLNSPDSGNKNLDGNESAVSQSETDVQVSGKPFRQVVVHVDGMNPGDTIIIRMVVHLGCEIGAHPTGNILNTFVSGSIVGDGAISSGSQTVPMKKVEDIAQPGINVDKTCPQSGAVGSQITYSITVTNTGNETLTNLVVNDPLLGGNLSGFGTSLAAGASVTKTFNYTIKASDPDPLPNSVTATANGQTSGATVQDTAACSTDVTHQPGISVSKSCPGTAHIGDTITYSITVTNTGNEDLTNLVVNDPLLGGNLGAFPGTLAVGASSTKTFTYTITAQDPDPLTNSVTATAKGADSGQTVQDTDSCETDILHNPGIDVAKTCPGSAHIGDTITYSITVTNTGDEALTNLVVNDPLLGGNLAGFGSTLAVGGSVTKTFTHTIAAGDPDPLTNTVTATAKGADSAQTVQDTDSCNTDVLHNPGISVTKTCPKSAGIGDTITYSITVTNTGDEALENVSVVDTVLGGPLGSFPSTLAVGASVTKTFTHTVSAGDPDPLTNTVTASGSGVDSQQTVSDQDSCTTDITHVSGIDVQKTCPATGHIGDTITYSITVTNTGNEQLDSLVVNDPLLGGNLAGFGSTLAVGASVTKTFTHTITAGDPDPLTNTVTATASGHDSKATVSDTSSCQTDVLHTPGIDVQKTCPASANIGDTITYSITVTNTGDEALNDLVVNDPLLGGNLSGFGSTLAVGASVTKTFTHTVTDSDPDPLVNSVTASGTGADSDTSVSDTASCSTDIKHQPGISVTKSCPDAGGVGDTITYSITVTNTGNEALNDLVVNDPLLGGDLGAFPSTLSVGQSVTKTFDHTITAGDPDPLTNSVTATATGADSKATVEDSDSCSSDVLNPQIDLVKGGPDLAHVGDPIPYTFTVTNTGDTDLHDVTLVDPICDDGTLAIVTQGDGDAVLAVGETWTYGCTHVVTAEDPDPLPNTATVSGTDDLGHTVTDTDSHVVDILHPGIQVVKTANPTSGSPGDTITYTYEVTNTSTDTILYDVSVDDDVIGHIGDIPELDPGVTVTLTATFTLGNEPVTNVVIASGHDALGEQVQDDDTAIVQVVLPKNEKNPPKGETAFTGANTGGLAALALGLMVTGLAAVILGRRRRGFQS